MFFFRLTGTHFFECVYTIFYRSADWAKITKERERCWLNAWLIWSQNQSASNALIRYLIERNKKYRKRNKTQFHFVYVLLGVHTVYGCICIYICQLVLSIYTNKNEGNLSWNRVSCRGKGREGIDTDATDVRISAYHPSLRQKCVWFFLLDSHDLLHRSQMSAGLRDFTHILRQIIYVPLASCASKK